MTNPSKDRGDRFERQVVITLQAAGLEARRSRAGWEDDLGDIFGIEGWTLQLKSWQNTARAISAGVTGAIEQSERAKTPWYAAIIKRNGTTDPNKAYVVMELEQYTKLLTWKSGWKP